MVFLCHPFRNSQFGVSHGHFYTKNLKKKNQKKFRKKKNLKKFKIKNPILFQK